MQPVARRRGGRGGKSLSGGGKCDASTAASNRELNLGLQFQNRVQTTGILQFKKKKLIWHVLVFSFPHPWIPSACQDSPPSQDQRLGGTGVFLGSSPAALKNLGTSAACRWGRSCWG